MFALRISDRERQMIVALALRLQRSQSDAIRLLIREAFNAMSANPAADSRVAVRLRTPDAVDHVRLEEGIREDCPEI